MKRPFALRILFGHVSLVLAFVILIGILGAFWYSRDLKKRAQDQLLSQARIMAVMPWGQITKNAASLARITKGDLTLLDPAGRVIFTTDAALPRNETHYDSPEIQAARLRGEGQAVRYEARRGGEAVFVALAVGVAENRGYLLLSQPLDISTAGAGRLSRNFLLVILMLLIPGLLFSSLYFWRLYAPIKVIEAHTRRVKEQEKYSTLMIDSDDELGRIAHNINSIVQSQEQKISRLQEEMRKIEAIFASMTDGIMVTGAEGRIESHNAGMLNILGLAAGDIIGKTPLELLRSALLQEALSEFQKTGMPTTSEISLGFEAPRILEVSITAISPLPGGESKTLLVFRDVTKLRALERIRADFVASLTHELKTPLTALVGFSETLLKEVPAKETLSVFLTKIHENALRLNRLIDDLFMISSIEQGETKLERETFPLRDLMEEVISLLQEQIQQKGLLLENKVPPDFYLWADRDGAWRIFLNVLVNAVKFTPAGGIEIDASPVERGYAAVSIKDTGIGIPAPEISRLGERFYRVDKTRSRQQGGSGLGLSIVKHLLNLHGGWMKIASHLGAGTVVTLYFPQKQES